MTVAAPIRVVVADDESSVRALLGIALGMERDFAVVGEANDGEEAITMVADRQPDAVVLDLMMPRMSGMEAIARIRVSAPGTKIVVFSALSAAQMSKEALSRGADAYVEKAKFVTELSNVLHHVCDGSSP